MIVPSILTVRSQLHIDVNQDLLAAENKTIAQLIEETNEKTQEDKTHTPIISG